MPPGYRVVWGGEYEEYTASRAQLQLILPVTLALIFVILFALYNNFKFPFITCAAWCSRRRLAGCSRWSSRDAVLGVVGIGFLALFGVSVQTAIVYISYVNELRRRGRRCGRDVGGGAAATAADHDDGAGRRVRLLPAALSTASGRTRSGRSHS
jgi:cobalt-zinc-cadmium resistance protein CzcA